MASHPRLRSLVLASCGFGAALAATAQTPSEAPRQAALQLSFSGDLGPLRIDRIALGQGGESEVPMWSERTAEIRALHPRFVRLFLQEYYDLLPVPGRYHFDTLDRTVELVQRAGSRPFMCLTFKPKLLFPAIDQDIVEPNDWAQWEALVYALVSHYAGRGLAGLYWEIGNEGDIGETGGCPYRFTPEAYTRYYRQTAAAILRADPSARVGGPAVSSWRSRLLPALLQFCATGGAPLHFVSWHIYTNDPAQIEDTIAGVKSLLTGFPQLHPETILDEWNMALTDPPDDPRIQPCFITETAWRMIESGLDASAYFQIRDFHVERDRFVPFFSAGGASFMAAWWNRMPQYDGLFDYQNVVRPAYFAFLLLSRLTGTRHAAASPDPAVHAFLTHDPVYGHYSLLVWNYSASDVDLTVQTPDAPAALTIHRRRLDAATPSSDENARLHPLPRLLLQAGTNSLPIHLDPYGIEFWSLETQR